MRSAALSEAAALDCDPTDPTCAALGAVLEHEEASRLFSLLSASEDQAWRGRVDRALARIRSLEGRVALLRREVVRLNGEIVTLQARAAEARDAQRRTCAPPPPPAEPLGPRPVLLVVETPRTDSLRATAASALEKAATAGATWHVGWSLSQQTTTASFDESLRVHDARPTRIVVVDSTPTTVRMAVVVEVDAGALSLEHWTLEDGMWRSPFDTRAFRLLDGWHALPEDVEPQLRLAQRSDAEALLAICEDNPALPACSCAWTAERAESRGIFGGRRMVVLEGGGPSTRVPDAACGVALVALDAPAICEAE